MTAGEVQQQFTRPAKSKVGIWFLRAVLSTTARVFCYCLTGLRNVISREYVFVILFPYFEEI